jgi:predicted amidohydrolase
MPTMLKVAAIQMVSTPEPVENKHTAARYIGEAAEQGATVVLLPEYWAILGRHDTDKLAHAEPLGNGPLQEFMSTMACECGIWLIGGTIPLVSDEEGKVRNTLLAYGPDGQLATHYDKIHLFGFSRGTEAFDESRTIVAGDDVAVLQTSQLRVGLSICYDLRFPELYRAMGLCDLICWSCQRHLPTQRVRRIGKFCSEHARSKTNALFWPPPKVASMRLAVAPGATAC